MAHTTTNSLDGQQNELIFGDMKGVYAQCGGFADDAELAAINMKFASVNLNFNSGSTFHQLPTIHPRSKSTNRRGSKPVSTSPFEHRAKRFRKDLSILGQQHHEHNTPVDPQNSKPGGLLAASHSNKPRSSLLELPGEIRTNIYRHLFLNARVYLQPMAEKNRYFVLTFNVHLNLRVVSKTIRAESDSMFYEYLTVIIRPTIHESRTIKQLPSSVLDRLQSLILVADRNEHVHFSPRQFDSLPSLKRIIYRLNDSYHGDCIYHGDFGERKDEYLEDLIAERSKSITDRISIPDLMDRNNDWFGGIVRLKDRAFSVRLEHELAMGFARTENACDAQYVGQVLLFAADTERVGKAQVSWLTASEYKSRHECYLAIDERELDKSSAGEKPHNKYQLVKKRWKYMCYRELMETFEKIAEASQGDTVVERISSSEAESRARA